MLINKKDKIDNLLSRMTFPPGVSVKCRRTSIDGKLWISASHKVVNSDSNPNRKPYVTVVFERHLNEDLLAKLKDLYVVDTIIETIESLLCHEVREWTKLDGKHIRDPHPK